MCLDDEAELWLDVEAFRVRLAQSETHDHPQDHAWPDCLSVLDETVKLYRDDFMAGFTLSDSPTFDEWQHFQTEGLRAKLARALDRLARGYVDGGEYDRAIEYARRWLALDPLREPAHRYLMQLYTWSGQRAALAIESRRPDDFKALAFHHNQAGNAGEAAGYLLQADDRARAMYAHEEAIDDYQGALEYLKEANELDQAARTLMKLGLTFHNAFQFQRARRAYDEGFALRQRAERPHMFALGWNATALDTESFVGLLPIPDLWRYKTYSGLVEQARRVMDQKERPDRKFRTKPADGTQCEKSHRGPTRHREARHACQWRLYWTVLRQGPRNDAVCHVVDSQYLSQPTDVLDEHPGKLEEPRAKGLVYDRRSHRQGAKADGASRHPRR